jgi:DNA polymerase I-like protein with 3'-5' exonuclease and polymerase domains
MDLTITDDLSDVRAYLAQTTAPVIVDIETTAITVGKGQVLCVGFAPEDRDDVLVWWPKDLATLGKLVVKRMVAHNSPFEERWLKAAGCRVRTVWDTMFMAHQLDENHPVGLKDLGQRLLGFADWADDDVSKFGEEFGQHWEDRVKIPRERFEVSKKRVSIYNGMDVHATRELLKWQRRFIKKNPKPGADPIGVMRTILLPAVLPLTQMEDNRLPVRTAQVSRVRDRVEAKIAKIEKHLDASIPPKDQWPDWLQKTTPKWGNTNWTKWWLYEYQGALVPRRTKPTKTWPLGNPGLSQEDLGKIDHPAARLMSTRSTLYKQLTGFLAPIEERTVDGRISTSFSLTGTVTGRLSSRSPGPDNPGLNSQQIPRDKATRNLFGEKGAAWIEVDFSQLELRVAAVMAQEPTMLQLFATDADIHTYIAGRVTRKDEKDVTKGDRTLAKGVNFGFLYGMMAKHFADYVRDSYGVTITRKEAEVFREEYFANFSQLPVWYRKQRAEALEQGGVHNEFGRFRHLPRVYHEDFWVQENAFRQAINSPVQSTGSDFMLVSLGRLARDERLPALGAKLITTVHDSVCLTAPFSTAKKVGRIVKETMENADDQLSRSFYLKADVTISRCWGGEALAEF